MKPIHPKTVRRRLLTLLYERYLADPLEMLSPEDILETGVIDRSDLLANMHYLSDRNLVEMLLGYNPPSFAAVRITANGIDLVENRYEFNLRFPPEPGETEEKLAYLPHLVERLVEEVDFSPLDGEARKAIQRDVQYLRDELYRPAERWRVGVVETVLDWIAESVPDSDRCLPSLPQLRALIQNRSF